MSIRDEQILVINTEDFVGDLLQIDFEAQLGRPVI
jgi:hypothetical protein